MILRIFTVIFLMTTLISATTVYGGGGFNPTIDITFTTIPLPIGIQPQTPQQPPNGFWFKPDADRERLKEDYSECRGKGEKSCMREKGYTWATF